ncbi:hypothetical protein FS749_009931 [Ceratobasidium sp. UAMH 11750]|nr:hypothetical protein FS749_009931 [Ceratobasidium sp. UAMH 11750]
MHHTSLSALPYSPSTSHLAHVHATKRPTLPGNYGYNDHTLSATCVHGLILHLSLSPRNSIHNLTATHARTARVYNSTTVLPASYEQFTNIDLAAHVYDQVLPTVTT